VSVGERSIRSSLNQWINPSVANCKTLQVDLRISSLHVLLVNECTDCRDVVSTVAFSCDEQWKLSVLRELVEEVLKEDVEVSRYLSLVDDVSIGVLDERESSSSWLIDEQKICVGVPAVWICLQ